MPCSSSVKKRLMGHRPNPEPSHKHISELITDFNPFFRLLLSTFLEARDSIALCAQQSEISGEQISDRPSPLP